MKKLVLIIAILMITFTILNAQGKLTTGEVNFFITNNDNSTVEIRMELVSLLCWDDAHDITYLFDGGSLYTDETGLYLEFLSCWETTPADSDRTFGLGYYKFTGIVDDIVKDYFYIDYRTSDLPENFGSGDINIKFDISNGNFYYYATQTLFPSNTSIWEEKEWIEHLTSELEPLPPDNFNLTSSGDHPYLTWSHSTNTGDYWTGYKIYREICAGGNPYFTEDDWIATVGKYTTGYIDPTYYVGNGWEGYYCVKAINGSRGSDFSEILEIDIDAFSKESEEIQPEYEYYLSQNYPNPFNPLTTISFSLKENSNVTLKVFDILGREVSVLINGILNAGNHQVQFNGSGLESGVYFYEIKADKFRDVKKLILTK